MRCWGLTAAQIQTDTWTHVVAVFAVRNRNINITSICLTLDSMQPSVRISHTSRKNYMLQEGDKSGIQHLSISIPLPFQASPLLYCLNLQTLEYAHILGQLHKIIIVQLLWKCFPFTSEPLVSFPNPTALMSYFSGSGTCTRQVESSPLCASNGCPWETM